MKLEVRTQKVVGEIEWSKFVSEVYGRPYNFQQQDDCKSRGTYTLTVPSKYYDDYANDTVPENVNDDEMGVSFSAWLARDPKQKLSNPKDQQDYCLDMWWERNFYPNIEMVANDLHAKGLLDEGEYLIDIDW